MFLSAARRVRDGALIALVLCACALPAPKAAFAADTNSVKYVRTVHTKSQTLVEVTLWSSRSFGARNEVVHMDIGKTIFMTSHNPKSGDEKTLIFTMTSTQFKALADKTPVVVSYGHDAQSGLAGDSWTFGPLDKNLLDKK